jgi:hypothetical protein
MWHKRYNHRTTADLDPKKQPISDVGKIVK